MSKREESQRRVSPGGPGSRTGAGTGGGRRRGTGGGDGLGHTRRGGPGQGVNRGSRAALQDRVLFSAAPGIDRESYACVLCCVDDTDDITGDISTGYVAERIAERVAELGGEVSLGITRHQLLLADEVAYTSHNSAMCLMAYLPDDPETLERFRTIAVETVLELSVVAADPGLCIAVFHAGETDAERAETSRCIEALHEFGRAAQTRVCTKEEAYALAERIPFVELSEHGGTGLGVIGAIAGVGLRLGGSDGRFRGKWNLESLLGGADALMAVDEFCETVSRMARGRVSVVDLDGAPVDMNSRIELTRKAKPILHNGALTFVVGVGENALRPAEKVDLGMIGKGASWERVCERFEFDNDVEECAPDLEKSCRNCLYRRWTARGFTCVPA